MFALALASFSLGTFVMPMCYFEIMVMQNFVWQTAGIVSGAKAADVPVMKIISTNPGFERFSYDLEMKIHVQLPKVTC